MKVLLFHCETLKPLSFLRTRAPTSDSHVSHTGSPESAPLRVGSSEWCERRARVIPVLIRSYEVEFECERVVSGDSSVST